MPTNTVRLSRDHIERQSKCRAEKALEELIWNGLDAGGPGVEVTFERNGIDGISAVEIKDHGTGIPFDDLERAFGFIGRSLKLEQKNTMEGRAFHGSEGRGRFRAVVLGTHATWTTTYKKNGEYLTYTIVMDRASQESYDFTEPQTAQGRSTGTIVRVEGVEQGQKSLASEATAQRLTQRLALYLNRYPVSVSFDGQLLDARACIKHLETYPLEDHQSTLDVIEWTFPVSNRELLICDPEGFAWHEMPAGIPSRDHSFTAFLRCPQARAWHESGEYLLGELSKDLSVVVEAAKEKLRHYLRERLAREATDLVRKWKEEKIYPYKDFDGSSQVEAAERQVFDIVASQVHIHHPSFRESPRTVRHLTLQLVRQALESNPSSLKRILQEVIHLPREQQDELATLFEYTNLGGVIAAANEVTQRLKALAGFEELIFSKEWKSRLRERTQLHRLLVRHLWIFGDEYSLDTDDEGMKRLLERHIAKMGRHEMAKNVDIKLINGRDGIPDLMLSRRFERDGGRAEHLVLELKRPAHDITDADITQLENYAYTIAEDERFSKDKVRWTFVLLGNGFTPYAKKRAVSENAPYGRIHKEGNLTIWLRQWSDVLHDARSRYDFFRKKLELEVSSDDGLAYLKDRHAELVSGKGLTKKQERERQEIPPSSLRVFD